MRLENYNYQLEFFPPSELCWPASTPKKSLREPVVLVEPARDRETELWSAVMAQCEDRTNQRRNQRKKQKNLDFALTAA